MIPHTNHVKLYEMGEGKVVVGEEDVRWNGLPFLNGYINKNRELVLGGFDRKVARFAKKGRSIPTQATTLSRATTRPTRSLMRSGPNGDWWRVSRRASRRRRTSSGRGRTRASTSTPSAWWRSTRSRPATTSRGQCTSGADAVMNSMHGSHGRGAVSYCV